MVPFSKNYRELMRLDTFEDRYEYLRLRGRVGEATFGYDRWQNQDFYRSKEWKDLRDFVIVRDNGCDLAFEGRDIHDRIIIHHMNPMTPEQIMHGDSVILDPDYLISVTHKTHNAIHYGDSSMLAKPPVDRIPGDTIGWNRVGRPQYP